MESAFYINGFAIMFILLFGIMAIFFLAIGLKGILTKQPFLVSNRWLLSMMFIIFIPTILLHVLLLFISNFNWINGLNIFLFGFILLMMWYQLKGYVAYAVTDTSFREALLAALQKLQYPHEETLSTIRLTSIDADLQVAVQSWMGAGVIKVKQRTHRPVLKKIINAMNEHFSTSSVPTNMTSCIFFLVMGIFMILFVIGLLFLWHHLLTLIG